MQQNSFEDTVEEDAARMRVDVYLADRMDDASRTYIKKLIRDGRVTLDGRPCKRASRCVNVGERVYVEIPPPPSTELTPEDIPLDILHEDASIVIVNKASGMVVHPAVGHYTGTLLHAVLHHCPDFQMSGADPSRPGVVHRLDRFTSGVMVVAKTQQALTHLAKQAREHTFDRRYVALVRGEFPEQRGVINAAIGRSTAVRGKMAVTGIRSREAVTHFAVEERFGVASLVSLQLETGRTHQIRVHLRFAGRPVLGDPVYGVEEFKNWHVPDAVRKTLEGLRGQALHAERLGIQHPTTNDWMTFTAPPPADFQRALDALRAM